MKAIKLLASYTMIYIVASFFFHLNMDLRDQHFTLWEYCWLGFKLPVFGFCVLILTTRVRVSLTR